MAEREIALRIFGIVQARFPRLSLRLAEAHPSVDLALDIPAQEGLAFDLHLNLQNGDELHLAASGFWCSWSPCTDPVTADAFLDGVLGLVAGRCRIVELRQGSRVLKRLLQRPRGGEWETLGTAFGWLPVRVPWGSAVREHVVRNEPCDS